MSDVPSSETLDLLREIRNLLVPVSDAYADAYRERLESRRQERIAVVRALLSTEKRRAAWSLADGSRTPGEIGKQSGMVKSGISTFFKELRELGVLSSDEKPRRLLEDV